MSEPVDIVAEAKAEYAEAMSDYPQHAETAEAEMIMRLIAEVERLRAENIEYKEKIARAILYSDNTSAWL